MNMGPCLYCSKTSISKSVVIFIESHERLSWAVVLQSSAPGWYPLLQRFACGLHLRWVTPWVSFF